MSDLRVLGVYSSHEIIIWNGLLAASKYGDLLFDLIDSFEVSERLSADTLEVEEVNFLVNLLNLDSEL